MDTQGIAHLKKRDKTLGRIISGVGPCTLAQRKGYFPALCQAIVSQQLSGRAAATIFGRLKGLFPRRVIHAQRMLALTDAQLRGAGVSPQKIGYLRDLARKFTDASIPHRRLASMEDEAVIEALTTVKGVGVWTVQMFLIFVLNRPDVLPVADLGIRKAAKLHYGFKDLPDADELTRLAEPWRPYRSLATWYLWQSLNKVDTKS